MYRAAVGASKATGATITTHGVTKARDQARILLDAGQDPNRAIIGHSHAKIRKIAAAHAIRGQSRYLPAGLSIQHIN